MRRFYVDLKSGTNFDLILGPFATESTARKYEIAAAKRAGQLDPLNWFKSFGVVSITGENPGPGRINDEVEIAPGDLMKDDDAK